MVDILAKDEAEKPASGAKSTSRAGVSSALQQQDKKDEAADDIANTKVSIDNIIGDSEEDKKEAQKKLNQKTMANLAAAYDEEHPEAHEKVQQETDNMDAPVAKNSTAPAVAQTTETPANATSNSTATAQAASISVEAP